MSEVLRANPHVLAAAHGEFTTLLDIDRGHYYSLNETGGMIWDLLSDGSTETAILNRLMERFDGAEDVVLANIKQVIGRLQAAGLVERVA
jgi:hypothetical protein